MPNFPQSQLTSNEKVFNENKKVIVFSMGTLLEPAKMPIDKFKTIVEGLAKLESMAVIWKYDAQQMVDHKNRREFLKKNAPNVHIMPRFDTRSVLSNPKTRLLISECDSRSALDAVHAQKPLLCMPMFAEHFYVAEKLRRAGVAVVLLPHDTARITSDALVDSIKFVDANYAHFIDKMKVLHDEIENEKINPAELFLKAFEEIGKNSE
uniref:glucuronosyltransferase n=1 Tax=Globodera pallida TaxID=36090 RepID=A0A183BVD3_GLOPA